jgi:DNA-binding NarL/FixJ family response regulator
MRSPELETKRVFLVACKHEPLASTITQIIQDQFKYPTIFTAMDGMEALFKAGNVRPHVAIVEADLSKSDGFEVAGRLMVAQKSQMLSVIILGEPPDQDQLVDYIVTGQVQLLPTSEIAEKLPRYLTQALNRISLEDKSAYKLRFLAKGEYLFHEGEKANSVFIVKSGELAAIKRTPSKSVILGNIFSGEFVGEMAHINDDNRSATVQAVTDCELIEIPRGKLDLMLFSKPAWAKALIDTLSKRLKNSNELVLNKT